MEVVQAGFGIEVVAAVAEGVGEGHMFRVGDGMILGIRHQRCDCAVPPFVIAIGCHQVPLIRIQADDISLGIVREVVRIPTGRVCFPMHVVYPVDAAVHIHQVFHAASVAAALPQRLASSKIVGRRDAVHRLRCPDAAVVILVGRARPRLAQGRQLPAVLPSEGQPVTVRQRVPYLVIGDALTIVRRQLILPVRVRISIGDGGIPGGLRQDVPSGVVRIGRRHASTGHGFQLVQRVVGIALLQYPVLRDGRDVPVRVVAVPQRPQAQT